MNYLCDGGADETIINEVAFSKIRRDEPNTKLQPYFGPPFFSCTGEMNIKGQVTLSQCIVDPKNPQATEGITFIVADHNAKQECNLGRDLSYKIPSLKYQMEGIRNQIGEMSRKIDRIPIIDSPKRPRQPHTK